MIQIAVKLLAENYRGLAQICNIICSWMKICEDSGVHQLVEQHLKELITKNFDPKKADTIFTEGNVSIVLYWCIQYLGCPNLAWTAIANTELEIHDLPTCWNTQKLSFVKLCNSSNQAWFPKFTRIREYQIKDTKLKLLLWQRHQLICKCSSKFWLILWMPFVKLMRVIYYSIWPTLRYIFVSWSNGSENL